MPQISSFDQYLLELINRARLDPAAEAARYGVGLGSISAGAKQPLAGDPDLAEAAENHSKWMLATDTFSHYGAGGSDPGDRMADAGYVFSGYWTWGENIAWQGTWGAPNLTQTTTALHAMLFQSSGHRANILNDVFREGGMGVEAGEYGGYNAVMATENFARSGSSVFVTGVAYTDGNGDDFYTPGEAMAGVRVDLRPAGGGTLSTTTAAAGGYDVAAPAGSTVVTFSGGGLAAPVSATVSVGSANVKVDLVGSDGIASSASLTLGAGAREGTLLGNADLQATGNGLANLLTGNAGDNTLTGGAGADTLEGGAGDDVFVLRADDAEGDRILDFDGNGSGAGDLLRFEGYGTGATLTSLGSGRWQVSDGARTDVFSVAGAVGGSDYVFGGGGGGGGGDPVTGTAADDSLLGGAASDTIDGGLGNDTVRGYQSADALYGGAGADFLSGGGGNDTLVGGAGADTMIGHIGADRLVYRALSEAGDRIHEFLPAEGDRLDLRPLFDALGYGGSTPLADGWLRAVQAGTAVRVEIDADGGGGDFQLLATLADTTTARLGGDYFLA